MTYSATTDNLFDSNIQLEMNDVKEIPPANQLRENFSLFFKKIEVTHEFLNKSVQIDSRLMGNQKNDELRTHMEKSHEKIVGLLELMNLGFNYFIAHDPSQLFQLYSQTVCNGMNACDMTEELAVFYEYIKLHDTIQQHIATLQQEINERKKIEFELNRSEEFFELVLKSGRKHCWDWDIQTNKMNEFGYIASTSYRTLNSTEYTFESFINGIILEDREKVTQQISQALTQGELELEIEYRSLMVSNTLQWVNFRGKIFYDANRKPQRMIGIEVIMTEHKKIKRLALQQREKLDHITQAVSMCEIANTLANELTNPFVGINTNINDCIQYLESDALVKEPIIGAMRKAIEHVTHAGKIIHRMKNFYRKTELYYETIIINNLIKEAVSLIQYENIHDTPATLIFDLPENSFVIEADKIHMKQVLLNLMRNSIRTMHAEKTKHPTITIRIVQKNSYSVSVCIEDNGSGIDADVSELLFTSHFVTKPDSTCMELAIVHTIIEAHGGQFSAYNLPEGGACFQFTLPILLDESNEQAI